jgi:hypothetical protein
MLVTSSEGRLLALSCFPQKHLFYFLGKETESRLRSWRRSQWKSVSAVPPLSWKSPLQRASTCARLPPCAAGSGSAPEPGCCHSIEWQEWHVHILVATHPAVYVTSWSSEGSCSLSIVPSFLRLLVCLFVVLKSNTWTLDNHYYDYQQTRSRFGVTTETWGPTAEGGGEEKLWWRVGVNEHTLEGELEWSVLSLALDRLFRPRLQFPSQPFTSLSNRKHRFSGDILEKKKLLLLFLRRNKVYLHFLL